jgi:hypothetical protein
MRYGGTGALLGFVVTWVIAVQWAWLAYSGKLHECLNADEGCRRLSPQSVLDLMSVWGVAWGVLCGSVAGWVAGRLERRRFAVLASIALALTAGAGVAVFRMTDGVFRGSLGELAVRTALPVLIGVLVLERVTRPSPGVAPATARRTRSPAR